jgi:two-component system chemotaxis sensor kinase CheA
MDDLLRDFVVETTENIDVVDSELVRFEQDPNNTAIIAQIFRLVHTVKGTCGFLGLPRLEALSHAAESAIDRFREGAPVTRDAVTLILSTIDRIKVIIAELDRSMQEPQGEDSDLIQALEALTVGSSQQDAPTTRSSVVPATDVTLGTLVYQVLERELRPGEVPLDELECAFRETEADEREFGFGMLERAGLANDDGMSLRAGRADDASVEDQSNDAVGLENSLRNNTIRVPIDTLEHLMTMVSELVLTRNQLLEISRRDEREAFKVPLQRLSLVTAELQETVMKTRMQPIGNAWTKLPRLIRDLCQDLGKDIELTMLGAETEIDRQLLELIKDPMLHMIRNAADHGIETAGERVRQGKPPKGHISISALQEGGYIALSISDDGRGLDLARIRQRAIRQGMASEKEIDRMSDQQVTKFIFHAGFSTAEKVTNVSGRGVGMDIVRNNIEQMGGAITVKTVAGASTTIDIKIPLTLAIAAALIVESGGQRFALPQMAVVELVRPGGSTEARIEHIHAAPVLRLRKRLLPLVQLNRLLAINTDMVSDWNNAFIVVCKVSGSSFGIVVDSVLQTEEIVVKPVSAQIRHLTCYSGATILGDGTVIMILDPSGLAQNIGSIAEAHNDNSSLIPDRLETGCSRTSLLIFKAGAGGPKAVPLALVTRLEEIDISRIEQAGGKNLVQYRGKLMDLVMINEAAGFREAGKQPVLVLGSADQPVGLVVDEIIDIIDDVLDMKICGGKPGILGSAIIRDCATDIVDVAFFVPKMGANALTRGKPKRRLLLVEPSDLLSAMLAPVLQAAGYAVQTATKAEDAADLVSGSGFDVAVISLEDEAALSLAATAASTTSCIGYAGRSSAELREKAHLAGFKDVVGTFDREGLLASLATLGKGFGEAA